MTDSVKELIERLKAAAEKATPGPWEFDHTGDWLSCDEPLQYAVTTSDTGDGYEICDTLNRGYKVSDVQDDRGEGPDGPQGAVWDERSRKDCYYIALANPQNITTLCDSYLALAASEAALRERVGELEVTESRMRRLQLALNEIAIQNLTPEIVELYGDDDGSDYEMGYNEVVKVARKALEAKS